MVDTVIIAGCALVAAAFAYMVLGSIGVVVALATGAYFILPRLGTIFVTNFCANPLQNSITLTAMGSVFFVIFTLFFGSDLDQDSDGDFDTDDVHKLFDTDGSGEVSVLEYLGGSSVLLFGLLVLNLFLYQIISFMTNIYIASSPKRQHERNNALRISKQKENKTLCTNILSVCNTFKLIYVPFAAMLIYVLYNYFAQGNGMDFDNDGDFDAEDLWLALDTDGDGTIEVDEAAGAIAVVGGGSIGILMMIQTVVITTMLWIAYRKVKAAREKDTKEMQDMQENQKVKRDKLKRRLEAGEITQSYYDTELEKIHLKVNERAQQAASDGNLDLKDTDLQLDGKPVSSGSFGAVFLGVFAPKDPLLTFLYGVKIAAKILKFDPTKREKGLSEEKALEKYENEKKNFLKERHILSTLKKNVNIVFLHGYVPSPSQGGTGLNYGGTPQPGLILEAIGGGSLEECIHDPNWKKKINIKRKLANIENGTNKKMVDEVSWFDIILGLAKGIAFLHDVVPPVIHKDLKPANILVHVREDGKIIPKITDYGESTTENDTVGGGSTSGYYKLPAGEGNDYKPTTKWDVFSFGVIVNEIYSKTPPFFDQPGVCFNWDQENNAMNATVLGSDLQKNIIGSKVNSLRSYQTEQRPTAGSFGNHNGIGIKEIVVQCWSGNRTKRPEMADVVKMLNGNK